MSYKLEQPYTDKQRADFIVLHNHQNGRKIEVNVSTVPSKNIEFTPA
jgi:hypothetical protein